MNTVISSRSIDRRLIDNSSLTAWELFSFSHGSLCLYVCWDGIYVPHYINYSHVLVMICFRHSVQIFTCVTACKSKMTFSYNWYHCSHFTQEKQNEHEPWSSVTLAIDHTSAEPGPLGMSLARFPGPVWRSLNFWGWDSREERVVSSCHRGGGTCSGHGCGRRRCWGVTEGLSGRHLPTSSGGGSDPAPYHPRDKVGRDGGSGYVVHSAEEDSGDS